MTNQNEIHTIHLNTGEAFDIVVALRQADVNPALADRIKKQLETFTIHLNAGEAIDVVAALRQTSTNPMLANRIREDV